MTLEISKTIVQPLYQVILLLPIANNYLNFDHMPDTVLCSGNIAENKSDGEKKIPAFRIYILVWGDRKYMR